MDEINKILIDDLSISYIIKLKRTNKNTYLRVKNGILEISSPVMLDSFKVETLIRRNIKFIRKSLLKKEVSNSDTIHIFGLEYKVFIVKAEINSYKIEEDVFYIYTKLNDKVYIKKLVANILSSILNNYLKNNYEKVFSLFDGYLGICPSYIIKDVKSSYGKYDKRKHLITFSTSLARYETKYIDLVIAHEFCHIKHMNHQKGFYKLFESIYTNARFHQCELRKIKYNDIY